MHPDLVVRAGRLLDGRVVDIPIRAGSIDADGRIVTPLFFDATAIAIARAVRTADYRRETLLPSIRRTLQEAVRNGTLHTQAFVDVDTAAGLEGLHAVLAARAEFHRPAQANA